MNTFRNWLYIASLCFLTVYGIARAQVPPPVGPWQWLGLFGAANLATTYTVLGISAVYWCAGNADCVHALSGPPAPVCVGIFNCAQPPFSDPPPITWDNYNVNYDSGFGDYAFGGDYAWGGMGGYTPDANSFHVNRQEVEVPEPGTLALMMAGLAGLWWRRARSP